MAKARKDNKAGEKSNKADEKNNSQAMTAMNTEDGHIDKIRDIIFGRQMADYEKRFAQLEDRITSQIDALRKEAEHQFKTMKDQFQKHRETLTERLTNEESKRGQEDKALAVDIVKVKESLSKAIDSLSAQQIQDAQSLSEQLSALSNELSDGLYIQQKEASQNLEQAVLELDDAKLTRTVLSQILTEMADRLSDPEK